MVKGTPYLDLDLLDESKAYYREKPLEEGNILKNSLAS